MILIYQIFQMAKLKTSPKFPTIRYPSLFLQLAWRLLVVSSLYITILFLSRCYKFALLIYVECKFIGCVIFLYYYRIPIEVL